LTGGINLPFMLLPKYRAWVIVASVAVCISTWYMIERTKLGAYLRAATENRALVQAFGRQCAADDHADLRIRRGTRCIRWRDGSADLSGESADGRQPHHRRIRRGGHRWHGLDPRRDRHRLRTWLHRGLTKVFYPEASNTVIFVIMVIVLLIKPAGLFGKER
jgi:branched-chain amino acid transport system permease protein